MALTARISTQGGPDVIDWIDTDLPPPGPGTGATRLTRGVRLEW